jgi:hypothetical protein
MRRPVFARLAEVFFRFAAGLLLVALVATAGVRLEKQTLELRRAVTLQYYQTDLLLELLVRLRLETQRLTAPAQLAVTAENAAQASKSPAGAARRSRARTANQQQEPDRSKNSHLPLLRFQQPFNPEGID